MQTQTATRPNIERDIRELAQAIATLEVVVTRLAVAGLVGQPAAAAAISGELRAMADRACFERDGCCPVMLDRVAVRINAGHQAIT